MPNFIPSLVYKELYLDQNYMGTTYLDKNSKDRSKSLDDRHSFMKHAACEQIGTYEEQVMRQDVAMWYGALNSDHTGLVRRVFSILYYGRMFVKRKSRYEPWKKLGGPIATALSHGGRVLVQLPHTPAADKDKFWKWLWPQPQARKAATHALSQRKDPILLGGTRKLYLEEGKGFIDGFARSATNRGQHFGMNVALGGEGKANPWTGNRISADGQHGHLYILYYAPLPNEYGGLLIGCEGSAPTDRMAKGIKHGMDQSGGVHNWQAKSSKYSPTGGLKFANKVTTEKHWYGNKKKTEYWCSCGPTSDKEGIVVDLIGANDERDVDFVMQAERSFESDFLGQSGYSLA